MAASIRTTRRTILIIDDEIDFLEPLRRILAQEFRVLTADRGESGLRAAQEERPDLILLDLIMPDVHGITVCEALRTEEPTRHIPIIVLTGVTESEIRVRALRSGADDLVSKPFHTSELLARIHSKIRRIEERDRTGDFLDCGNLQMNLAKLEVTVGGRVVPLSVLEFNLLRYFVENRNRVIGRQQILDAVWQGAIVSDRTVDTHMASLRKKLAGFDHAFTTIYAAGYMLADYKPVP